jgi:hypothetical protein
MDGDLAEDARAEGGEVAEPIGEWVRWSEMRRNGMEAVVVAGTNELELSGVGDGASDAEQNRR